MPINFITGVGVLKTISRVVAILGAHWGRRIPTLLPYRYICIFLFPRDGTIQIHLVRVV